MKRLWSVNSIHFQSKHISKVWSLGYVVVFYSDSVENYDITR